MRIRDKIIIDQYYRGYYILNYRKIYESIKDPESREFALINNEGNMKRHLAIEDPEELLNLIKKENPYDLYHSTAYYLFPDKPMEEKERRAADLVFDLDADHISGVPLNKVYKCEKCGEIYKTNMKVCGICGGRLKEITIIDSKSIDIVKQEVDKLINILVSDFGIKEEEMKLYFSGSRGFHIHIETEKYSQLDSMERLEIKDYITLEGIDLKFVDDPNARPIHTLLELYKEKKEIFKKYFNNREMKEIEEIFSKENAELIYIYIRKIRKSKRNIIDRLNTLLSKEGGIGIDGVVTVDTSRLIRAPYSLHGKTGLIKNRIPLDKIDEINFISYSSFGEEVYITTDYIPNIKWGDYEYNEMFNTKIKVPISLAIYLINKGLAYGVERI